MGSSKLEPPKRFCIASSNALAILVHLAEKALCGIKALRCSQPIKRSRSDVILFKSSFTVLMQLAEGEMPVSAALP